MHRKLSLSKKASKLLEAFLLKLNFYTYDKKHLDDSLYLC